MSTKTATSFLLATALVAAALAGCGGGDTESSGAQPSGTFSNRVIDPPPEVEPIDACALVTAADAGAILGVEPVVNVEFPFRVRAKRGPPGVVQPEFLGDCLWQWESPAGEPRELALLQFTIFNGQTWYSDPPLNEGTVDPLDIGDRGLIVELPPDTIKSASDNEGKAFLVSFVVGEKTVWLDAAIWRNPNGRADLLDMASRVADQLS